MIKTVIRYPDNMVMVFDNKGEQISEYQDQYNQVKEDILKDAPLNARFFYMSYSKPILQKVTREEW